MKKYTQPQVEITAFDFEDITMSSLGANATDIDKANFGYAMQENGNGFAVDGATISW